MPLWLTLDGLGGLHGELGGDGGFPLPQQRLHEVRDVASGDGDVFDARAYHVAVGLERELSPVLKAEPLVNVQFQRVRIYQTVIKIRAPCFTPLTKSMSYFNSFRTTLI